MKLLKTAQKFIKHHDRRLLVLVGGLVAVLIVCCLALLMNHGSVFGFRLGATRPLERIGHQGNRIDGIFSASISPKPSKSGSGQAPNTITPGVSPSSAASPTAASHIPIQTSQGGSVSPGAHIGALAVSPASVTIDNLNTSPDFTVTAVGGANVGQPQTSASSSLYTLYRSYNSTTRSSLWYGSVQRTRPQASGQTNLTITAYDEKGNEYRGSLLVNWPPIKYFSVEQGALGKTVSGAVTTYSVPLALIPGPNFGNPTLRMSLGADVGCSGGTTNIVESYSGQNNYVLTCSMSNTQAQVGSFFIRGSVTADWVYGGANILYTSY